MPTPNAPSSAAVTKVLKDAVYVSVGLGVIAFQKAQVQRQEIRKALQEQLSGARTTVDERVKLVEERLDDIEARVDSVLDELSAKLPDGAEAVLTQARQAAKEARAQVRSLVNN
ncbi:MAG: hypothetical protein H0W25_04760 [Acidimicrobiia bacterium]|nr:hypothetical protein [Acidimicrobiia bacterium]